MSEENATGDDASGVVRRKPLVAQLRILTNSSAADVAMVLTKLDPKFKIISTTGNKITVR